MTSLKPYFKVERPPCPFYGFNGGLGYFIDTERNHCALKEDSYSLCGMERIEEEPNWNLCPLRQNSPEGNGKKLEEAARRIKIFPREFRHPKTAMWESMHFIDWVDYIMNKK